MRAMTLQEIQQVNLEIMIDIHDFCVKHGIHYSLAYGTLIGAIRHKGFIPWDDDIDIMMTRPDFERFSKEYQSEKGFKLSSVNSDDTYINYTRVYDGRTLVISPAKAAKYDIGVWVDIFPVDAISDDDAVSKDQYQRLRKYAAPVIKWRSYLRAKELNSVARKIKSYIRLLQLRLTNKGDFSFWHQQIISICKENSFGTTKRCSCLVCVEANRDNKQAIFLTDWFKEYVTVPFEDQQFFIIADYDPVLKSIYGDYMRIPPKEEQVSHSLSKFSFFWK